MATTLSRLNSTLTEDQISDFGRIALLHADAPLAHYAAWLQQVLEADAVFIGELAGGANEVISVVAQFVKSPKHRVAAPYNICGGPCEIVAHGTPIKISEHVAIQYPEDDYLVENGFEAYVGVPLRTQGQRTIDLVSATFTSPLPVNSQALTVLEVCAAHIASLLAPQISQNQLERLQAIDHIPAGDRFARLAQEACLAARARAALICLWDDTDALTGTVITFTERSVPVKAMENANLALDLLPCGELSQSGANIVLQNPAKRYPLLGKTLGWAPATYIGVCLDGNDDTPIGHMALVSDEPMTDHFVQDSFWSVLVARVGLELMRHKQDHERSTYEQISIMRQKDDSLASITGHIAHDFNNLLMGILGNTDLALISKNPDKLNKYLHGIRTSSLKASDLVSQLLNYAGKTASRHQTVDLRDMLAQCEGLLSMSVPDHIQLSLTIAPPESANLVATLDASQLEHVILNLLLNAVEACGDSGAISVNCDLKQLDAQLYPPLIGRLKLPGNYVTVTVADNGNGMDIGTVSRIFDPFFSTKEDGRGLGLSTVRGFVLNHGAALDVKTFRGRGTEMQLYFPAVNAQPDTTVLTDAALKLPQFAIHDPILVVDDDPLVRQVVSEYLHRTDVATVECANGKEALRHLESHPVSAIVSDVAMPEMDGWTLLRHVRERQPRLPFLLMSGYTDNRNQTQSMDPYTLFLRKPFVEGTLYQALAQIFHPEKEEA